MAVIKKELMLGKENQCCQSDYRCDSIANTTISCPAGFRRVIFCCAHLRISICDCATLFPEIVNRA